MKYIMQVNNFGQLNLNPNFKVLSSKNINYLILIKYLNFVFTKMTKSFFKTPKYTPTCTLKYLRNTYNQVAMSHVL